jgi:hypothetical protein
MLASDAAECRGPRIALVGSSEALRASTSASPSSWDNSRRATGIFLLKALRQRRVGLEVKTELVGRAITGCGPDEEGLISGLDVKLSSGLRNV